MEQGWRSGETFDICELSLLLILVHTPRRFQGTPVFLSPQKEIIISKFQFDLDTADEKSHYVDVHCKFLFIPV